MALRRGVVSFYLSGKKGGKEKKGKLELLSKRKEDMSDGSHKGTVGAEEEPVPQERGPGNLGGSTL